MVYLAAYLAIGLLVTSFCIVWPIEQAGLPTKGQVRIQLWLSLHSLPHFVAMVKAVLVNPVFMLGVVSLWGCSFVMWAAYTGSVRAAKRKIVLSFANFTEVAKAHGREHYVPLDHK